MKKFVQIFTVDSYHKGRTDQGFVNDGEETVTTELKPNGWTNGEVIGKVSVHTTDKQSPDWADMYIVTVEKLENVPENKGTDLVDFLKAKIEEKRQEGNIKPIPVGRKFR